MVMTWWMGGGCFHQVCRRQKPQAMRGRARRIFGRREFLAERIIAKTMACVKEINKTLDLNNICSFPESFLQPILTSSTQVLITDVARVRDPKCIK